MKKPALFLCMLLLWTACAGQDLRPKQSYSTYNSDQATGKWGYVNANTYGSGNWVIQPVFDYAESFYDGMAAVKIGSLWGFIDKKGQIVIPCQWESVGNFADGLASVKKDGKWGAIDCEGNTVVHFLYDYVAEFSKGYARVRLGDKWGFVNKQGTPVTETKYDKVSNFNGKFAKVKIGERNLKIDTTGKEYEK